MNNMHKLLTSALTTFVAVGLISCGDRSSGIASHATASTEPHKIDSVTIDADSFTHALYVGQDMAGRKKEDYVAELKNAAHVKVLNAYVYQKDTSSDQWLLVIGDNSPRIICQQKTRESKVSIKKLDTPISHGVVEGDFDSFNGNRLYLNDCLVQTR